MKKTVYASIILLLAMIPAGRLKAEVKTGDPAPAFTLQDTDGEVHSLADHKGEYVVLEWTNPDCPFVKKHYESGNMQDLQAELTEKGVAWYTIASSAQGKQGYYSADQWNRITEQNGSNADAVLLDADGSVGKAYGAQTTPHMFLISPEGTILYQGAIDSIASADKADIAKATNYVKQAYEQASGGQPVAVPSTKSYGCSIKYAS